MYESTTGLHLVHAYSAVAAIRGGLRNLRFQPIFHIGDSLGISRAFCGLGPDRVSELSKSSTKP